MNKNYYELYKASVFSLAETLVIKSEDTADLMNALIKAQYGESAVSADKSTWKYYKNICGEYHSTDTPITVVSLDTLQTITFSRENLLINTATKKAYQYGSRNYRELVSLNPQSELLILGILYPADMDDSIAAPDNTILSYPAEYVEENEVSLIKNLNAWIQTYRNRWYNVQYGVSDSLYTTTFLGQLYLNLVPAIFNFRLRACKTEEAHTYHIRQYLASHGMLDTYLDSMTTKQALFFYRNIAYIERNNGKQHIFNWLVEHIMTERNLPVAELTMRHDVSLMPAQMRPQIEFRRKAINSSVNTNSRIGYSLTELLAKEAPLVKGNSAYIKEHGASMLKTFENSLSSVVATKVLDSSVIDYTDATPFTFYDIAISHWLAASATDMYSTFVTFKNPRTGARIGLHCKDAFIFFAYTLAKALGGNPTVIPPMLAKRVPRTPLPTTNQMLAVVNTKYVTTLDVVQAKSYMPLLPRVVSVDAFLEQCKQIFKASQNQLRMVSSKEHQYTRGLTQNMINRMYIDRTYPVASVGKTFSAWMTENNLPTTEFTMDEFLEINKEIFEQATGTNLDSSAATKGLQLSMIHLMQQLSSYSIQFITEVNGSNVKVLNWSAIRVGDVLSTARTHAAILNQDVDVQDYSGHGHYNAEMDAGSPVVSIRHLNPAKQNEVYDIPVKVHLASGKLVHNQQANIGTLQVSQSYADPDLNPETPTGFMGYDAFKTNYMVEGHGIQDVYDVYEGVRNDLGNNFTELITQNTLEMYDFMGTPHRILDAFTFDAITGSTEALILGNSVDTVPALVNTSDETILNAFVPPNEPS